MLAMIYLHVNSVTKKSMNEEIQKTSVHVGVSGSSLCGCRSYSEVNFRPYRHPFNYKAWGTLFTQYEMKQISELSTGYAICLYELLICWRATGKTPVIELVWLSAKDGCSRFWISAYVWFKKRFRAISQKQINEHTDITATYEQHKKKKRRVITGFSFKFKQKKPKQAEIATETPKNSHEWPKHDKNPFREPQIAKYSMILCKLGSISDLSNFPTIQALPIGLQISWEPLKKGWANSKTNFHSIENRNWLQQEKLIFNENRIHQMNGVIEANLINISSKIELLRKYSWQDERGNFLKIFFSDC